MSSVELPESLAADLHHAASSCWEAEAFLFCFQLPLPLRGFNLGLHALGLLARLILVSALHYPLHDGAGVHLFEFMVSNLAVNAHLFGRNVDVIGEGHEGCRAVIDRIRRAPREGGKVTLGSGEGSAKNDGVDILQLC